nr:hypothetical protein BaRGS_007775 [Batillaria attramentaria]
MKWASLDSDDSLPTGHIAHTLWVYNMEVIAKLVELPQAFIIGAGAARSSAVLEIKASKRTGEENFMSAVRKTLQNHYKTKPVALGGVFLVEKGKAKLHVIPPKFPNTPLDSDEAVNSWLRFYEMDAILVCVGELVSHDPDLDLRVEHFHCFSDHGQGGHYHYDTTPNDVVYRAYFNVAEFVYRIDQPVVANKIYHS